MENSKKIRSLTKAKIKLCQTTFDNFVLSSVASPNAKIPESELVKYTTASGQTIMVKPSYISVRKQCRTLNSILRIYWSNLSNSSRIIHTLFND